jgi:hypothetical protein
MLTYSFAKKKVMLTYCMLAVSFGYQISTADFCGNRSSSRLPSAIVTACGPAWQRQTAEYLNSIFCTRVPE